MCFVFRVLEILPTIFSPHVPAAHAETPFFPRVSAPHPSATCLPSGVPATVPRRSRPRGQKMVLNIIIWLHHFTTKLGVYLRLNSSAKSRSPLCQAADRPHRARAWSGGIRCSALHEHGVDTSAAFGARASARMASRPTAGRGQKSSRLARTGTPFLASDTSTEATHRVSCRCQVPDEFECLFCMTGDRVALPELASM